MAKRKRKSTEASIPRSYYKLSEVVNRINSGQFLINSNAVRHALEDFGWETSDILNIYTDGRQVIVDAVLFAGYENQIVPDYTTIGSTTNFTIEMSGYFNTDAVGYPKYLQRKTQASVVKNKALAPPVVFSNYALSREIKGWNIWRSSIGYEVTNENNIPVLVVEYKNPYIITVSGLFATPMGVLKVDNTKDTIFLFGDSPFELGSSYIVDRIRMRYPIDLIRPERTYILSDKGRE